MTNDGGLDIPRTQQVPIHGSGSAARSIRASERRERSTIMMTSSPFSIASPRRAPEATGGRGHERPHAPSSLEWTTQGPSLAYRRTKRTIHRLGTRPWRRQRHRVSALCPPRTAHPEKCRFGCGPQVGSEPRSTRVPLRRPPPERYLCLRIPTPASHPMPPHRRRWSRRCRPFRPRSRRASQRRRRPLPSPARLRDARRKSSMSRPDRAPLVHPARLARRPSTRAPCPNDAEGDEASFVAPHRSRLAGSPA